MARTRLYNGSSKRQEAFQIPLLIELAVRGVPASASHRRHEPAPDLDEVRANVFSFFHFTKEQKRKLLESGAQPQLYQEIHQARHKLVLKGQMTREQWGITEKGLKRLREYLHGYFQWQSEEEPHKLDEVMAMRGPDGPELFIRLLQACPEEILTSAIRRTSTRRELFLECLRKIPLNNLGEFLVDWWEELRDQLGQYLRESYRDVLAQV